MNRILNLTQHTATTEQIAAGVTSGELSPEQIMEIRSLLTFETLPSSSEVAQRAQQIAKIASCAIWREKSALPYAQEWAGEPLHTEANCFEYAMIGGAPYLMAPLESALRAHGITPMYAFSVRESVDQTQPDGSVRKVAVFRHAGFVGCEEDEPETIEELPVGRAAQLIETVAFATDEWRSMHKTTAESVTALFDKMAASDDAYNLELSADGLVGSWSAEGYLSIGKTAEISAVLLNGIVYRF
jgi:hypothetical protein